MARVDHPIIREWLDATLVHLVAESHLDGIPLGNRDAIAAALTRGSNRLGFEETQFLLMTASQVPAFLDKYEIVDHHANDATGFSATVVKERSTGQYTIAFRSTEPRDSVRGGDYERDGFFGADGQIARVGFATAQLTSMETYWSSLRIGALSGAGPVNVVGYSLGAHLALLFTEMRPEAVAKTTVFDAAGRGQITAPGVAGRTESALISEMLSYYRAVLLDPDTADPAAGRTLTYRNALRRHQSNLLEQESQRWYPFAPADPSLRGPFLQRIYPDPRHAWAMQAVKQRYALQGLGFGLPSGQSPTGRMDLPGYDKVVQLFGHAMHGDIELAANSGIHPPAKPVFIEGQPWIEGTGGQWIVPRSMTTWLIGTGDYAGSHSLILIVDTLEAMLSVMGVDPSVDKRTVEAIFATASNQRAWKLISPNVPNLAGVEADSLETAIDAFRRLYLAPSFNGAPLGDGDWRTPVLNANGGYGDVAFRTSFHENIRLLDATVASKGSTVLVPIVSADHFSEVNGSPNHPVSQPVLQNSLRIRARQSDGLAYRYALQQLNSFVAIGNDSLYQPHNQHHELEIHDPVTNPDGAMTDRYLEERVAFLSWALKENYEDRSFSVSADGTFVKYVDRSVGRTLFVVPDTPIDLTWARESEVNGRNNAVLDRRFTAAEAQGSSVRVVGFGGINDARPLRPSNGDDALFGTSASDVLHGGLGSDYLEGGRGKDYLIGGLGDDTLFGGRDVDTLSGGRGYDTYIWNIGDEFDTLVDQRDDNGVQHGRIVWQGESLSGTKTQLSTDNFRLYGDGRGLLYYLVGDAMADVADLVIVHPGQSGGLFVRGFRSGDLGITLAGASPPPTTDLFGTDRADSLTAPAANFKVYGLGGDDSLIIATSGSHGFGGPGDDVLYDSTGNSTGEQYLHGESGNDNLVASAGRDELRGGLDQDFLQGGHDDDFLDGGLGSDFLAGGRGADVLMGGDGVDWVDGGSSAVLGTLGEFDDLLAVIDGFRWSLRRDSAGNFRFIGLDQAEWLDDAGDVLDGDAGDDFVFGGYGDDLAYGGDGADGIIGGPGGDTLHGDAGNDNIMGGPAIVLENSHYAPPESDGSDYIDAGAGDDLALGHAGTDVIYGGDGTDELYGELGHIGDLPIALHGADFLDGGAGNDRIGGDGGDDILIGGEGDDVLIGDSTTLASELHGSDDLDGGAGADQLFGQGGSDTLAGGADDDLLEGDSGDTLPRLHGSDLLDGESGNDTLTGGGGDDLLFGGDGMDILVGDASNIPVVYHGSDDLDGGAGDDQLFGGGGKDGLAGGEGNDTLWGDEPFDATFGDADFMDGGEGNDRMHGGGGDDILLGGAGDDVLFGDAGNDILDGGPGDDLLQGGAGDDTYILRPGEGNDRVVDPGGAIDIALGDDVTLGDISLSQIGSSASGVAPIAIALQGGNTLSIEGPLISGRLRLSLADGARATSDELLEWSASQQPRIAGTGGDDELTATGGSLILAMSGDDTLLGSSEADTLYGGEGNDVLDGAAGNDVLAGGLGDDVYVLGLGTGTDTLREVAGAGIDTVFVTDDFTPADIRFRRSGDDLQLRSRLDDARAIVESWFAPTLNGARGVDAADFADRVLEADAIAARVIEDATLRGTSGDDVLRGDELTDILIGGQGNDTLAGLAGDDRYVIAAGDGDDTIEEAGGFDTIEFGAGIEVGAIDLEGRPRADGSLDVVLTVAGTGNRLTFGAAREQRIDAFVFDGVGALTFDELAARVGGLRQNGSEGNDRILGSSRNDALYGHGGDDVLEGEQGSDLINGGAGNDQLAGGPNNDTYVFQQGDGRDRIVEFYGNDEYHIFRASFSPRGERTYVLDGIPIRAQGPIPGPQDELYNVSLGDVVGGLDVLSFGEGIAPDSITLGLKLLDERRPYAVWNATDSSGTIIPGVSLAYAEQAAYVLELPGGDAVEIVRPNAPERLANLQALAPIEEHVPVERFTFETGETLTIADLFDQRSYAYVAGTEGPDRLTTSNVRPGGALIGRGGDDVYVAPEQAWLTIVETPNGGEDTVVFGNGATSLSVALTFDQSRLSVLTASGSIVLDNFALNNAASALVEWFEFPGEGRIAFDTLLARGIDATGTFYDDVLYGTSGRDRIESGQGNDRVSAGAGDDQVDGGLGDDVLDGGAGNDRLRGGRGRDVLQGGGGEDVFQYGHGDGDDLIEAPSHATAGAALAFDAGVDPTQVNVTRSGSDLVLALPAATDRVTIAQWFDQVLPSVGSVSFASGTVWDVSALSALAATTSTTSNTSTGTSSSGGATSTGAATSGSTASAGAATSSGTTAAGTSTGGASSSAGSTAEAEQQSTGSNASSTGSSGSSASSGTENSATGSIGGGSSGQSGGQSSTAAESQSNSGGASAGTLETGGTSGVQGASGGSTSAFSNGAIGGSGEIETTERASGTATRRSVVQRLARSSVEDSGSATSSVSAATEEARLQAITESWFLPSNQAFRDEAQAMQAWFGSRSSTHAIAGSTGSEEIARAWAAMHEAMDRARSGARSALAAMDEASLLESSRLFIGAMSNLDGSGIGIHDASALNLQAFQGLREGVRVIG